VSTPDPLAALRSHLGEFIESRCGSNANADVVRATVLSDAALSALPRVDLEAALDQVLAARHRPRLLVDWGELPQVGRAARPLFSLIAPSATSRPTVKVSVDRSLDNDAEDPLRQVRTEEAGLWSFYVPFDLTTNGSDARPGLYVIDVAVSFPHGTPGQPRFLQTRIRLSIPDAASGQRELVIDGDGQSVVNLAGHDLRSFSRVVLKGDDKSIINLQNFAQAQAAEQAPKAPVVFEYELKIDRDIQERLPRVVEAAQGSKAEAMTLVCGDRRIHVFAKKRATFGRQRRPENDVCLRFLPRSAEHDEGSRAISRTHMALEITDDGLVLADEKSAKGIDVDCDPVKGDMTFTHVDALGGRQIDLPSGLSAALSLEMELTILGKDPETHEFRTELEWDDVCLDVIGEQPSRLWHVAKTSGIEAARIRRLNNANDEEYVFLYRHATVGRSAKENAIVVPHLPASLAGDLRLLYAGRMFWLHSGGRARIAVDGEPVTGACLIPLRYGQLLEIDLVPVHVVNVAQVQLDEDPPLAKAPPRSPSPSPAAVVAAEAAGAAAPPPLPPVLAIRAAGGSPRPDLPPALPGSVSPRPADGPSPSAPASSGDPVRDALRSVAVISGRGGHGSGFVAAPGILVTNYHVVADEVPEDCEALFYDPASHAPTGYRVSLVAEDPEHDLAFLAIDPRLPPLPVCDRFEHHNGHKIVVIGSPGVGGNGERLENVVTDGRLGPIYADGSSPRRWALSTTLNPGNSGGPVLDAATGEVLGVTVAKFTTAEGLALAVPHDVLAAALRRVAAASEADAAQAGSYHRQRCCLRRLSGFVAAADAALQVVASENDELDGELSSLSSHSLYSRQASGFAADFAAAIAGLRDDLVPQLDQLRRDPLCRAVVRADLEQVFAELESLGDLLGTAAAAGRAAALDRAAVTLRNVEQLCEGVRIDIDGSLQGGKSVYDADDAPSSGVSLAIRVVAAAPAAGGVGRLRQWFAEPHAKPRYLTKSRFALACTCPTKLFYTGKPGEYANEWQSDPMMESLAHEGNRVGALARLYFPGGVLVDTLQTEAALRQTDELLARSDVTIFEAAIRHGDLFIRSDILRKTPAGIELYEVKSKGYSEADDGDLTTASGIASGWLSYVRDVAFQMYVIAKAFPGERVQAFLFLPDKARRAPSDGLAAKAAAALEGSSVVLGDDDVAAPVMRAVNVDGVCDRVVRDRYSIGDRSLSFEDFVSALAEHYREDRRFQAPLSPACLTCEFDASPFALAVGEKSGRRECWTHLLGWTAKDFEKPLAFGICGLSAAKKKTLLDERRLHMADVKQADIDPRDDGRPGLSLSQRQWLQATKCVNADGVSHLDRDNLRAEMAGWRFPLHFIDFETCRAAIPFHRGSRPLDLVAFQFSHHVMHADGRIEHAGEFLCTQDGASPNAAFVAALREQIGHDDGAVLHYAPHEVSTLRSLAGHLRSRQDEIGNSPDLLAFIDSIAPAGDREPVRQVIDLCRLVKRFYYSPSMGGSNSIKDVLPAILRESEFLRHKYSRPIYGAVGGIPSRNFSDMAWVDEADGKIRDPYMLLPPIKGPTPQAENAGGRFLKTLRNGGAAMQAYADLVLYEWSDDRRRAVQQALLRYCELDTLAMVFIVEAWREWCRG
jgi:S1-C subfamily serine protease